jgi:electron transfer flavoprotein alpha subunit
MTVSSPSPQGEVWVFGDYRDYLKNRVTLELLSKARELASQLETRCAAAVIGHQIEEYVMEYIAHGAQAVYVIDSPRFKDFLMMPYCRALCRMVEVYRPQVLLIGGTDFGREFAPRVAKRLATGLSADCVQLSIDEEEGLLVQTTPAFGGRLLADVVTPTRRPQMATVRPGVFQERPHDPDAVGEVIQVDPPEMEMDDPVEICATEPLGERSEGLESATVVVSGGRGMGDKEAFDNLARLAKLLGGEIGGTRPAVIHGWIPEERMIGQTGRTIRPKCLITCGTSGALQYTASIKESQFIIAINRDPNAPIFDLSDLGIIGDARQIIPRLLQALESRIQKEEGDQ